jgi:hypothetical protein
MDFIRELRFAFGFSTRNNTSGRSQISTFVKAAANPVANPRKQTVSENELKVPLILHEMKVP